jgi:hypothetical protein
LRLSDEGHVLTASHCLNSCFGAQSSERLTEILSARPGQPLQLTCPFIIDGQSVNAEVVVSQRCRLENVRDGRPADNDLNQLSECHVSAGDVTILKVPNEVLRSRPCLPMNFNPPNHGSDVIAMGSPLRTNRRHYGARNADGRSFYFSTGQIINSDQCTLKESPWSSNLRTLRPALPPAVARLRNPRYFQMSADIESGSSGGPVLNSNLEIIGVASSTLTPHSGGHLECAGAQIASSLSGLEPAQWGYPNGMPTIRCVQADTSL